MLMVGEKIAKVSKTDFHRTATIGSFVHFVIELPNITNFLHNGYYSRAEVLKICT